MAVCFNPKPTTYMPDRPPVLDPFLAVKNLGFKCLSRADSSVSCNPTTTSWRNLGFFLEGSYVLCSPFFSFFFSF
ncbi:hypothetical protein V6Z11_D13G054100 [Gossypium hirsutum]